MMIPSMLTVIVPVYNVENYIHRCVDSILIQKYSPLEVILVDDGSTDLSGKICEEYASKDNRVKVFHINNGGAAAARNEGLKNSHGEFITFVDSDDWLSEDTYRTAMAKIKNADVLRLGVQMDVKKGYSTSIDEEYYNIKEKGIEKINHYMALYWEITVWNKIFRWEIIEKNKIMFPTGVKLEDNAFTTLYLLYAKTIVSIKEKYYHYYIRDDSIMGKYHILHKSHETVFTYISLFTYIYENMPNKEKTHTTFVGLLFQKYTMLATLLVQRENVPEVIDYAIDVANKMNIDPLLMEYLKNVKIKTMIELTIRNLKELFKYGHFILFLRYQKEIMIWWKKYHKQSFDESRKINK